MKNQPSDTKREFPYSKLENEEIEQREINIVGWFAVYLQDEIEPWAIYQKEGDAEAYARYRFKGLENCQILEIAAKMDFK